MKDTKKEYTSREKEKAIALTDFLTNMSALEQQKIFWIIKGMQIAREDINNSTDIAG